MLKILLSIYIWAAVTLITFLTFIFVLLSRILFFGIDPFARIAHNIGIYFWARGIIFFNPLWKFKFKGLENIDRSKTYILVSNHNSMADIICIFLIGLQFKWVGKEALFRIPIFGYCMRLIKYISLEREDLASIKRADKQIIYYLNKGISIFIFPEGTRSLDGKLQPFKNGAFKIAISEKKPVLPIVILGTRDLLPKGGWIFKGRQDINVKILPAIDTSHYNLSDFSILKELTRNIIKEDLEKI